MNRISKAFDRFMLALIMIAAVMGAFGAILATINALSRKILLTSFPWAEEFTTYLIVVAVFLSIPYLEWKGKQLTVDVLGNALKNPKAIKAMQVFSAVLVIILCFVVVRYGMESTITAYETSITTNILHWPKAIFYGIGVVSFILAMIASVGTIFLKKPEGGNKNDS